MKKNIIFLAILLLTLLIIFGLIIIKKSKNNKPNKKEDDYEINYQTGEFNLNIFKTISKNNYDNNLISPYSIEIALNMLRDGANGKSKEEIDDLIGNRVINDVKVKDRIGIANAAFIKNEYKEYVKDTYYKNLKDNYNSEILYDEFITPDVINNWVNEKTNKMIPKILDKMDPNFVLGIANAIAIDVKWDSSFNCNATTSEVFTKIDNTKIKVEMMHKTLESSEYKYLNSANATGVVIPYKKYNSKTGEEDYENGRNLEFIGILPKGNIKEYINNLSNDSLDDLINNGKNASDEFNIYLSLPRFKYDYSIDDFISVLKSLGINEVFDEEKADLSNIMDKNIEELYVGEAIHKTHIDLSEAGTKAAAVTYFGMFKNTAMQIEKETIEINFNKPFIYMIRDSLTKEVLFIGTVYKPNTWKGNTCEE